MAGIVNLTSGNSSHFQNSPSSSNKLKLCLFCLNPADSPERASIAPETVYFRQFLWKYLIGDDIVKITEFTANHLKNMVPPLCSMCYDKCMQLAKCHLEFEKIQEEIMDVSKDLLEGWKQKETLLTKEEYEMAVQHAAKERGRSKPPFNRFIKSPTSQGQQAFPTFESVQMYQILRNPGHVRIPLSCLKSFGFTEIRNIGNKNATAIANQFMGGPKVQNSVSPTSALIEKAKSKAAAVMAAAAAQAVKNSMPKMIPMPMLPNPTPKRYWINDVQVEMLSTSDVQASNSNSDEDAYEQDEEDEVYVQSEQARRIAKSNGQFSIKPIKLPALNMKRPKLDIKMDPDAGEYFEDEEEGEEGDDGNYARFVVKNQQNYDDDEILDYSNDESQQYYDENGDMVYEDDENGMYEEEEEEYEDSAAHQYYNGTPNLELDTLLHNSTQKKRKRVFVLRKGNWTAEEDQMISQIVTQEGPKNWSKVALQLGTGRTGKQIRERWTHHLNPEVNKDPWSEQEDLVLMEAHGRWGNQWSRISKLLPGRTDNAVKNHWNGTLKRKAQLIQFNNGGGGQPVSVDLSV